MWLHNRIVKRLAAFLLVFCLIGVNGLSVLADTAKENAEESTDFEQKLDDIETDPKQEQNKEAVEDQTPERIEKPDWDEDGELKILSIGNSFSVDCQEYLYKILKNLGVKNVKLGNLHHKACDLEDHLKYAKNNKKAYVFFISNKGRWTGNRKYSLKEALLVEDWDYITFQQSCAESGISESYEALPELLEIVSSLAPQAKLLWNMTWAYQENSKHKGFLTYNCNQMKMYKAIVAATQKNILTNEQIDGIIPVGTAIQNGRTSYCSDSWTRDGHHLSKDAGRYLAGVTFAGAITGYDLSKLTYQPKGITKEMRNLVIEAVTNALEEPFLVTTSSYNEKYRNHYYKSHAKNKCIVTGKSHKKKRQITWLKKKNYGVVQVKCKQCNMILKTKKVKKKAAIGLKNM